MSLEIKKYLRITEGPVFLPFFLGLLGALFFLRSADITLTDFPGEMIGIATLKAVDIAARVNLLYKAIFIFTSVFVVGNFVTIKLFEEHPDFGPDGTLVNHLSFFGILLILGFFFNPATGFAINLIVAILGLAFGHAALTKSKFQGQPAQRLKEFHLILLLSVGMSFLLREIDILSGNSDGPFFLNDQLVFIMGAVILGTFFQRKTRIIENKWTTSMVHLFSIIPFISVLASEICFIVYRRFSLNLTEFVSFSLIFLIAFAIIRLRQNRIQVQQWNLQQSTIWLFISVIIFAFYTPVIEQPKEMFELANPVLGLSRFFEHGQLPLLETFNSHLLFELLFGFLYTLLNGYHGLEFLTYDFLHVVLYYLILLVFLQKWFKSVYLSLGMLLLFPLVQQLFPATFAIILLPVFALHYWIQQKHFKSYLALIGSLTGLVLWKIDFGYGAVLAVLVLSFIFHVTGIQRIQTKYLFSSSLIIGLPILIITAVITICQDVPILNHLEQALHYLSSAQTYGYETLADEYDSRFFVHYLLFPATIWILFILILVHLRKLINTHPFETVGLLYLMLFYIFNFHRGMIRHGFHENSVQWLSSFAFFIIPATLILLYTLPDRTKQFRLFLSSSFLLVLAFDYPTLNHPRMALENLNENYKYHDSHDFTGSRVVNQEAFLSQFDELKSFMDSHLDENQTFYDYSNNPMLYYYLNRRVPSYFNQMLLSMHDEFLQHQITDTIEAEKMPYIIYSNFPENWYDMQDGVPKNVRHYHLAEYLHCHYKPFAIIDDFTIWQRNEIMKGIKGGLIEIETDTLEDGLLGRVISKVVDSLKYQIAVFSKSSVTISNKDTVYYPVFRIDDCAFFHILPKDLSGPFFIQGVLDSAEIVGNQINFYPNFYDLRPREYDLKWLPSIWASNFTDESYLREELEPMDQSETSYNYELTPPKDCLGQFVLVQGYTGDINYNECVLEMYKDEDLIGTFRFNLMISGDNNNYLIRVTTQSAWKNATRIVFKPNHYLAKIEKVELLTQLPQSIE